MSFIRRLEEAASKKLQKLFLNSKRYADSAVADLAKAEADLLKAKQRAVDATEREHKAAIEAAEKAQAVATQLQLEVKAAEERMLIHKEILEKSNK